ncbi:hypothetical protein ACJ41O_015312 [Fusarium nematophilum]
MWALRPTLRRLGKPLPRPHDQVLTLPDGRALGFAEYGSPEGKPLFYFHGYPSSRLEAEPLDEMARRRGIRLIALDRPGFGLSAAKPGRQILDWPADVQAFAKSMDIPQFAVLGVSGGGPYALACAYALPRMLTGVGLFASGPPWAAGAHHMSLIRRASSLAANHAPIVLKTGLVMLVHSSRWLASTSPVTRRIAKWLEDRDAKEQVSKMEKTPSQRIDDIMRLLIDEPFAQGADAAVYEAKLLSSQDWGFRFEDVSYGKVRIWHGVRDGNAPMIMIRHMAERLPHCVLYELEGDTHYTMFRHFEPAMLELVGMTAGSLR